MTFCCCLRQNAVFNLHLPTSSPPFLHPRTPYPSLYPQRALGSDELSSAHGRTTNELRRLSFSNMEHQQQQRYFYMEDYWCFCVICGFVVGSQASERPQPPDYWFDAVLFRVQPPKHHGPEPVNLSQPLNSDGTEIELLHASRTEGGPYSFYDPADDIITRKYYAINDSWQDDGYPWIAVHPKCLEIATRVVDFRKATSGNTSPDDDYAPGPPATDLSSLYYIYRARCDAQSRDSNCHPHSPPFVIVWEPHNYFGFSWEQWGEHCGHFVPGAEPGEPEAVSDASIAITGLR